MNESSDRAGIDLIASERARQISEEGWTPEHDDTHRTGQLARAAARYALQHVPGRPGRVRWPWATSWFKPSANPVRNLVKAGALIAAEIDRLQRRNALERCSQHQEGPR